MIIYAVADIHGNPKRISLINDNFKKLNPDILVVAGDITNYTKAASVITQLSDMPVPVLAVRGNADLPKVENLLDKYPNTDSLHFKQISLNGICFTGISGTIPVPFSSRICLREKRALNKLESLIKDSSVLVFHTPPRWTRDEVMGKFSAGSRNLYKFVRKNQPNVLICGHIHERAGFTSIGKTLVVNCSISKTCAGAIIDYHKGGKPKAKIIKRTDM
ncbi:MAG: metallophosphoesterase family protein [Deltaproteobacteria bacterium]|nr:metallophosphoesterase family protein [Deltaproteobacteria bacterium]MBW2182153.1 metallophosphoesterase family protein [Deltaproteobacteria bacterium]MBW2365033.1 metallophosphoesterase family protein [Deltaproteobacteria bacterium]